MTINEFINLLQSIKDKHGDLPVYQSILEGLAESEVDEDDLCIKEPCVKRFDFLPLRLIID